MSLNYNPELFTDMYEYTMLDSALQNGTAFRRTTFALYCRSLPHGRRYGVVGGTGRLLEYLKDFTISETTIKYLKDQNIVSDTCIKYLEQFKFNLTIEGYPEGSIYGTEKIPLHFEGVARSDGVVNPGTGPEVMLYATGTFAECVLLETLALSIYNYDSAVAAAGARMVSAAGAGTGPSIGTARPILEMGSRRTNEFSAIAAARMSKIIGFAGTSNLEAARLYGLNPIGTVAHAFIMLQDSEEQAFQSQIASMGTDTTFLVDTYDIETAIRTLIRHCGELHEQEPATRQSQVTKPTIPVPGAIRIDSGDLGIEATKARKLLDELGAKNTKIVITGDLDEYAIAALKAYPVNSFGAGTKYVTGSGYPTCQMVYKLVEHETASGEMVAVQKKSVGKASLLGKQTNPRHQVLVDQGVVDSQYIGAPGVETARLHFTQEFGALEPEYLRLSDTNN
jgi:nicotinate phosphoribosyltransferase